MPGYADAHRAIQSAEPIRLDCIEFDAGNREKRRRYLLAAYRADDRAILRSGVVDLVGQLETAGAGNVLHEITGLPGMCWRK